MCGRNGLGGPMRQRSTNIRWAGSNGVSRATHAPDGSVNTHDQSPVAIRRQPQPSNARRASSAVVDSAMSGSLGIALPYQRRAMLATARLHTSASLALDRLQIVAQCQVEGMRLVTLDRALARHPL